MERTLKKFVQVDQSGAEALIVAYCTKAGNYRKLFENKIKVHTYVAAHLFEKVWPSKMISNGLITDSQSFPLRKMLDAPIETLRDFPMWPILEELIKESDDWEASERYYFMGKQTAHSSNYDVKWNMFRLNTLEKSQGQVVLTREQAEYFLLTYHALFPEIRDYHRYVQNQVNQHKLLYNLHGHPYQITQYEIEENQWKELYSWIPQSTVGEITNIAYARMQSFIEAGAYGRKPIDSVVEEALDRFFTGQSRKSITHIDLLANTHDSYLSQCHPDSEVDTAKVKQFFIEQHFTSPIDGVKFQMKSEATSGWNWNSYKKGKNERGLRKIQGL